MKFTNLGPHSPHSEEKSSVMSCFVGNWNLTVTLEPTPKSKNKSSCCERRICEELKLWPTLLVNLLKIWYYWPFHCRYKTRSRFWEICFPKYNLFLLIFFLIWNLMKKVQIFIWECHFFLFIITIEGRGEKTEFFCESSNLSRRWH